VGITVRDHELLTGAIVGLLRRSPKTWPAWEIEEVLAQQLQVTPEERALVHPGGCPVFEKDAAFGLSRAVSRRWIKNVGKCRAPNGGSRSLYWLLPVT
jgi:hypothetical protein